jgi:hypothetical protein
MDSFIKDLERALGIERTRFDIDSLWKENAPTNALKPIDDFLATVSR